MTTQQILQGVHDWTNGKIVYDISAAHPDGQGKPTPYADLTAALGTGGANIPESLRKGGMSVKFIQGSAQSSDNKYVQFFCTADEFTTNVDYWQGVDDEPTAGSNNLVNSDGVYTTTPSIKESSSEASLNISDEEGYVIAKFKNGNFQTREFNSKKTPALSDDNSSADLNICDEEGNVLVQCKDGHVKTKNFDSSNIIKDVEVKSDTSSANLNIGDENGNVIAQFKGGQIKTKNFDSNWFRKKTWITCSHRGNVVGTSLRENTLAAYYKGAMMGCNMIETDARATSDGVLVCNHDATVTDANHNTYTIANITGAEAAQILLCEDPVYGKQYLPTLESCLNLCYYMDIMCNIDLKNNGEYAEAVARLVLKTGMRGRVYYAMNSAAPSYIEDISRIDEGAKFIGSVSAFNSSYLEALSLDLRKRCVIYSYSSSDAEHVRELGVSLLLTSVNASNINNALQKHPEILEYNHNINFEEIENNILSNIKLY